MRWVNIMVIWEMSENTLGENGNLRLQDILLELADKVSPEHTAVLVVDMQNDFCAENGYFHNLKGGDMSRNVPLAARIMDLISAARDAGVMVIWIKTNCETRHLSGPALAKKTNSGIEAICCEGGTWGWDFFEVSPLEDEPVVEKHTYSGFIGTNLDEILRRRGIKSLVMTGVATNVCVESTLRDGYSNGYYIVVPEDCVGSSTAHLHQGTLENVNNYFGETVQAGELTELWAGQEKLRSTG